MKGAARCHLNGLALVDGEPAYVTAVSRSDVPSGWRERRQDGGCVIDVRSNEVILTGLSMPHSPRWYRGKLWLLNSGTGDFGYVDEKTGAFEPLAFCPGYLRGLAFHGDCAVVGLSLERAYQPSKPKPEGFATLRVFGQWDNSNAPSPRPGGLGCSVSYRTSKIEMPRPWARWTIHSLMSAGGGVISPSGLRSRCIAPVGQTVAHSPQPTQRA